MNAKGTLKTERVKMIISIYECGKLGAANKRSAMGITCTLHTYFIHTLRSHFNKFVFIINMWGFINII
jgi:hypothetical protein